MRQGKRASTAAGEFVREEMEHIRRGKRSARSTKQAIAIGLSKARRSGVPLKAPAGGRAKASTRRSAARDYATGQGERKPRAPSAKRSQSTQGALKKEGRRAATRGSLSRQARSTTGTRRRPAKARR
jgi:hypothetical protein